MNPAHFSNKKKIVMASVEDTLHHSVLSPYERNTIPNQKQTCATSINQHVISKAISAHCFGFGFFCTWNFKILFLLYFVSKGHPANLWRQTSLKPFLIFGRKGRHGRTSVLRLRRRRTRPSGSQKGPAKTLDSPWRAASRAGVGGNLAASWTRPLIFLPAHFEAAPAKTFMLLWRRLLVSMSPRGPLGATWRILASFQHCKITERQGEWNSLKWTRLANNLEWTGVWIVHSVLFPL